MTFRPSSQRRGARWAFLLVVIVALSAFVASTALATLPGSTFEGDDGNLIVNTAGNKDWASGTTFSAVNDLATGQNDNSFGGGSKEDDLNVTVVSGSIPNSKADIGRFAVGSETLLGQVYLYLAWTRNSQSGTTNFDFEINRAAQPDLTTPGAKTLVRTTGDVLVMFDFQGGAQKPTIQIRRWLASGQWGPATLLGANAAEAEINRVEISENLLSPAITRPFSQFGETAINLTAAGVFQPNVCTALTSIYVKSRSSTAFTSAMKDFIAPIPVNLNNCGTIVINKVTVPSPDPTSTSFNFNPSWKADFTLANGGSNTTLDVQPGAYSITEDVPANWALTSSVCNQGETPASLDVGAGETVTCTFTNTLQTGAILISKTAKHAADEVDASIPLEGVDFDVEGTTITTDENGEACIDGLTFGDYTVTETAPAGYAGEDPREVTVDTTATCADDPYAGETSAWDNTPLTDITVTVDSQVDGGTASTIECAALPDDPDAVTDAVGDGSLAMTDLEPGTYTCTIVVDP